mgnify:CR=1 FL=1
MRLGIELLSRKSEYISRCLKNLKKPHKINNNCENEYELAKQFMNLPRFCGLLQSDGHFTVSYDKEKVQNPKIILSQTTKRLDWLCGIKDWLEEKGIQSSLPRSVKFTDIKRSVNLTIDRANCRRLISLIEKEEGLQKTPLLFDNKRVHFLLLKESIRIKQSSNQKSLTEIQAKTLVDIFVSLKHINLAKPSLKESGLKLGQGPKGLSRNSLIERLGFANQETKGCADSILQKIHQEVEVCGTEVLKTVLDNPKQINPALAEFIVGVFDGDGSFTVGLFTHLSKEGKKLKKRHTFEIVPSITLTTHVEEKLFLLKIINAAFGKKKQLRLLTVNKEGKGVRLVIKSAKILKEFVVPFFEKYPPSLNKNRLKFQTFCTVLGELPLDYKNKEKVVKIVRFIYETDLNERNQSLEGFLKIVELDYF